MKYIGNYKEWVNPEWIERIKNSVGDECSIHQAANQQGDLPEQQELYRNFCKFGYDKKHFYVNMFTGGITKDILDFKVDPLPFINMEGKEWHWWFIKTLPGQLSHWHFDPHTVLHKNAERYWVALHDYQPGQIFIWEGGNLLTDFKLGDVFKFDYAAMMHGTANISFTPRYSFQCTVYDIEDRVHKNKFYVNNC
jgi:hypothetical protein